MIAINTARVMIVNDHFHRTCVIAGTLHANELLSFLIDVDDVNSLVSWLSCFVDDLLDPLPTSCGLDRISIGILSSDFQA